MKNRFWDHSVTMKVTIKVAVKVTIGNTTHASTLICRPHVALRRLRRHGNLPQLLHGFGQRHSRGAPRNCCFVCCIIECGRSLKGYHGMPHGVPLWCVCVCVYIYIHTYLYIYIYILDDEDDDDDDDGIVEGEMTDRDLWFCLNIVDINLEVVGWLSQLTRAYFFRREKPTRWLSIGSHSCPGPYFLGNWMGFFCVGEGCAEMRMNIHKSWNGNI